jgi:hypothetical protein
MVGFSSKRAATEGRWTVTPEQNGDDLILPLPQELVKELDWQVDDTINWIDNKDGTWQIINTRTLNGGLMSLKNMD